MHILFCCKNQKNVLQREIKDRTFKAYLLTVETAFWFPLTQSLKITCARSYAWFLNFYWIVFLWHVSPKFSKITTTCPKGTGINRVNSDLPNVSKMNINFKLLKSQPVWKLYISSHGEARNIKFGQQVNIIERVPLGTPPQAVVMTIAHNHVINLFISSYREATVIKFGQ